MKKKSILLPTQMLLKETAASADNKDQSRTATVLHPVSSSITIH